jgi:hypothetical protein
MCHTYTPSQLQVRAMLAVPYFEKALYEMPEGQLTSEALQALADEVEAKVQGGLSPRPLLSVPHILADESSCYYHGCAGERLMVCSRECVSAVASVIVVCVFAAEGVDATPDVKGERRGKGLISAVSVERPAQYGVHVANQCSLHVLLARVRCGELDSMQ